MERELRMEMELVLRLTVDEADWLNHYMQDQLRHTETDGDREMRKKFLLATHIPKPIKPSSAEVA